MNPPTSLPRRGRASSSYRGLGPKRRSREFLLQVEAMEQRTLLSTFHWKLGVDGDFNSAASWQENAVPGPSDDAIIGFSGITATSSSNRTINSLVSNSRLNVSAGTFNLANNAISSSIAGLTVANGATFGVTGGTASITANAALSGSFAVDGSLALTGGTATAGSTTSFGGAGTYQVSGATLSVSGTVAAPANLELNSGTIAGSGTLNIGGTMTWAGGSMTGNGKTTVTAAGSIDLVGSGNKILDARTLANSGTITFTGGGSLFESNGATLTNSATIAFDSDADVQNGGGLLSSITNLASGSIRKTGGIATSFIGDGNVSFSNAGGTIESQSGTLQLAGGSSTGGTYKASAGSVVDFTGGGTQTITGTFTGSGAGSVVFSGGGIAVGTAGATFNFPPSLFQWTGGTISGASGTILTNSGTITTAGASNKGLTTLTLANSAGSTLALGGTGGIFLGSGMLLDNLGTIDFKSDTDFLNGGGPLSTIVNEAGGKVQKTGGSDSSLVGTGNVAFNNLGGSVSVQVGSLFLSGGTSSGGTYAAASGTSIDLSSGFDVSLTGTYTGTGAGTFTFSGGNATIGGPGATFNFAPGMFQWTGGRFTGGTLTNSGTFGIAGSANHSFSAITFANLAGATVASTGAGTLFTDTGVTINNAGTWLSQSDGAIQFGGGAGSTFNNTGTFTKTAGSGGETRLNIGLVSTGTLNAQAGTIRLDGGTISGPVVTAKDARIYVGQGTITASPGATYSGEGILAADGGTLTINTPLTVRNLALDSGTINGTANVTVSGRFDWTAGNLNGAGTLTVAPSAVMLVSGSANHFTDARTITNNGVVIWSGGTIFTSAGVTINNAGTWLDQADHDIRFNGGTGSTFNNSGTYNKTIGGVLPSKTRLNIGINSTGTLNVLAGNLELDGGTISGAVKVADGSSIQMTEGTTTVSAGAAFSGNGLVRINGGALAFSTPTTLANVALDSGVITGASTLTVSKSLTWAGGTMNGTGKTIIATGATFDVDSSGNIVQDVRTITNQGTTTWTNTINWFVSNNAQFVNQGTFLDNGGHNFRYNGGNGFVFHNSGTYIKSGTDESTTNNLFDNTGTVRIDAGTLHIVANGSVTQISNNELTGGTWILNGGTFLSDLGGNITSNKASITLGAGSTWAALNALATNSGSLVLAGGRDFTTAGDFTNNGSLVLGPGSTLSVSGKFIEGPNATLTTQIAGQPASGQFGQIAATGASTLDGKLAAEVVNGFGTVAGGNYLFLTYPSHTGDFSAFSATTEGGIALFTHATNATNATVTSVADASDLAFQTATVTSSAAPGQPITIDYTIKNNSSTAADVTDWVDSVYIALSDTFDPASAILLGRVNHAGGVGGNATYTGTLTAPLPALSPNSYRIFVQADSRQFVPDPDRSNNVGTAANLVTIALPNVNLGSTTNGTIGSNQDIYYRVNLPSGAAVRITATFTQAPAGELYVSYGEVPSRVLADESSTNPSQLSKSIVLPGTQAGVYFILIHGREGQTGGKPFSLRIEQLPLQLISASPDAGGNVGTVTLALQGSQFNAGATVRLVPAAGAAITATRVTVQDAGSLTAAFDLTGVALGVYDVKVTQDGQTVTLASGFRVTSGNPGRVIASITTPAHVRNGRTGVVTVNFDNIGDTDVTAPLFVLTAQTAGGAIIPLTLPGGIGGMPILQFLGVNTDGDAGVLPPHFHGSYTVTFAVPLNITGHDIIHFDLRTYSGDEVAIDWAARKNALRPAYIPLDAWDAVFANYVQQVGTTTATLQKALAADATYLGSIGISTNDVARLIDYEIAKANDGLLPPTLVSSRDIAFPTPGVPLTFTREFLQSLSGRNRLGRFGRGWTDNWDLDASFDAAGNALIRQGVGVRFFARQADGTYLASPGDAATLAASPGGGLVLREKEGNVFAFRTDGKFDYEEDPNGNRITASYAGGLLTKLTHANGAAITLAYNGQGRVTSLTDPAGRSTLFTYDASGEHLIRTTTALGITQYNYLTGQGIAKENALASVAFPDGTHEFFAYDSAGRVAERHKDGGAESLVFAYGAAGGYSITDGLGHKTTYLLTDRSQVGGIIDGLGRVEKTQFDDLGRLVKRILADGSTYTFEYDARGNITGVTDPLGDSTHWAYDPTFSSVIRFQDARGNTTSYTYDDRGNVASATAPDGSQTLYTYDARGLLQTSTNARGQQTFYTANSNGQTTGIVAPDGTSSYSFDARGNLVTASNGAGDIHITWNSLDLITHVDEPGGVLDISYDSAGRRTRIVGGGTTVNLAYDAAGRLSGLTDSANQSIVAYAYDAAGRLTSAVKGNGTSTTYAYDAAGQLLHLENKASGGAVSSAFDYVYNALGMMTSQTTGGVTTTYGYDPIGQLTSVTSPGQSLTYEYDPAGNRTIAVANGSVTSYTVNNRNAITAAGGTSFTYDADGNLATRTTGGVTTTFSFDAQGRITGTSTPGDVTSYAYDALGNRVSTTHNGQVTTNLFDITGSLIAQSVDGAASASFVYGLGLVERVAAGGSASFYDFNNIGSTVALTNAAGSVVNRYSYAPFGATTVVLSGVANPFTFVGASGVTEEAGGVFHMSAREYDPATGQFLSEDPLGLGGGDANFRRYVGNSPLVRIDPSGLRYDYDPNKPYDFPTNLGEVADAFNKNAQRLIDQLDKLSNQSNNNGNGNGGSNGGGSSGGSSGGGGGGGAGGGGTSGGGGGSAGGSSGGSSGESSGGSSSGGAGSGYGGGSSSGGSTDPITPLDPNVIEGPAGFGPLGFIPSGVSLPYTIEFENKASASAPAQVVTVTQQLSTNLDWTTFQLVSASFGTRTVSIPDGPNFYTTRVDDRARTGLFVDVTAGINLSTGLVTWTFSSIDPLTGDITADPLGGFLPPNSDGVVGVGTVSYIISAKAGLATGASIPAQAIIHFDGVPLATPAIVNTLDLGSPTGAVAALPAQINATTVPLAWSGSDDAGGSGIATYDIFVSVDGGVFTSFLTGTSATSANYAGAFGHTYGFYAVATDNVGRRQSTPASAQATTQLISGTVQPAVVQFSAASFSAAENAGSAVVTVTRSGNAQTTATVFVATTTGTATSGVNFTPISSPVVFNPGETSKTVTVPVLPDGVARRNTTVGLVLLSPNAGTDLGSTSTATLTIVDTDVPAQPAVFAFQATSSGVNEDAGAASVTITRAGNTANAASVTFSATAGSANPASQFTPVNVVVNFAPGETSKTVNVSILDDGVFGPDATVNLALTAPSVGAALGSGSTATLIIRNTDPAPIPPVTVSSVRLGTVTVKRKKTTVIVVTFSDVVDPASAQTLGNYVLANAGKNKKLGDKDDKSSLFKTASLDASRKVITLTPKAAFNKALLQQLKISTSGLRDAQGRSIDGNRDGQPGGNFAATLNKGKVTIASTRLTALAVDQLLADPELLVGGTRRGKR